MRLKIFGIPRFLLIGVGLLPTLAWCAFHASALIYHDQNLFLILTLGLCLALGFCFFFRRGVFKSRYWILCFLFLEIALELFLGILNRDFPRLLGALLGFGLTGGLAFWLDKRIQGADINPQARWFEGDLQTLPQIQVKLKNADAFTEASLKCVDQRGFFVFTKTALDFKPQEKIGFEMSYRELSIVGEGRLHARFLGERSGFGLQFLPKDLYHFNQYTALVQRLKGEGL